MAGVSYSKNVLGEPAAAEATATSSRRWLPGRERWLGIATIVAFVAIWEIVYRLGLMPTWAFPSPWKVVLAFQELIANGKLLTNTAASVGRQITGVFLAALVGIPAGLALGASPTARAAFFAALPAALSDPRHCLDSAGDPVVRRGLHLDRVRDLLLRHMVDRKASCRERVCT